MSNNISKAALTAEKSKSVKRPRRSKQDQPNVSTKKEVEAWSQNAERLAKFALEHLKNRDDAYGRYLSVETRKGKDKARTIRDAISEEILCQHFSASDHGHIVGLHSTSENNTCRWLVIDIDQHGEPDEAFEQRNEKAAHDFCQMLAEFGGDPLLIKSNGRGGYHVWLIFDRAVSSKNLHALGKTIVQHWEKLEIDEPEVFPKQPELEEKKLGNWVRLPGLHHTYEFHTQVWDGKTWLKGQQAIDRICAVRLCPGDLVSSGNFEIEELPDELPAQAHTDDIADLSPIERVLKQLRGVRRSGGGWVALCPVHADSEPSLSVGEGDDGKVLLNCFGCKATYDEIAAAVGLEPRELFPETPQSNERELRFRYPESQDEINSRAEMQKMHQAALKKTSPEKIKELAQILGVSIESLQDIEVAWFEKDKCWLFPERDGKRRIIGLMKRYRDNTKSFVPGGSRGLYIPTSFELDRGDILIAEGGSDTAAGRSSGWNIVGRPSANGGWQHLIELLKDATGRVFIIADNDPKRDGSWPGRKGAEKVAQLLQAKIKATVLITSPPMKFKDLRALIQSGELPQ